MIAFTVFSAILVLVTCQHDHHKNLNAESEHLFTLIDNNRDGDLSTDELLAVLKSFDTNDDQRVTEVEFYKALCGASPEICPETVGLFQELDTLNENVIWIHNSPTIYALLDTNTNGIVSRSEFVTWMTNKLTALSKAATH